MLEIVDTSSTDLVHLTAVQLHWSGVHIGGGVYFSANHFPAAGGSHTATPQQGLPGAAETHATTEFDFTLPSGGAPWTAYLEDLDGNGTPETVLAGFDISLQVGDPLVSTGTFYNGPSAPMLIANDPNDLSGNVVITGYPEAANSLNNTAGVLHQTTGTLAAGGFTQQNVGGDLGGYFTIDDAEAVGGMSGGGTFLTFDPDGDGTSSSYLIGVVVRGGTYTTPGGVVTGTYAESSSLSPHYAELASTLGSLTGADARTADDFARMVLLSAQTSGSLLTTVTGQFFHEDIYGGVNNDTLLGNGGNDSIFGRDGADTIHGGDGDDTLTGGLGEDLFIYSDGADVIEDFSGDLIQIERSLYSGSVETLLAGATVVSGNLVLSFGAGNSLTLNGVTSTEGLEGRVRVGAADPSHDVSGDGTSDILLRNASGALGYYDMAGGTPRWQGLGSVDLSWSIAGSGDFNGDGIDDILWRNTSGATGYYDMDGASPAWMGLGAVTASWTIVGTGDFNGDGTDDILWRNTSGATGYYQMAGGTPSWQGLGSVSTSWRVVGTGDFNGDGTDDILWRNVNGALGFYDMEGGSPDWQGLGSVSTSWTIVGTGDFNGDGTDDILWRNANGAVGFYDMGGGTPGWSGLGAASLNWDIVGIGDFNGDGTDDILWRNINTGSLGMYEMDNGSPTWTGLGGLDLQWDVTGQFVDEFVF